MGQERTIDSLAVVQELDSLKKEYPLLREVPLEYEAAIYKAVSYYPELKTIPITFFHTKIKTTLNAKPTFASVFKRRGRRSYVIRINNTTRPKSILLSDVSFNAKIGVLGHEFAHILDYSQRNFNGIAYRGLQYGGVKSKGKFEKEIDRHTIARGLGWQCYDWAYYVRNKADITPLYRRFKELVYLGPQGVFNVMKRYPALYAIDPDQQSPEDN